MPIGIHTTRQPNWIIFDISADSPVVITGHVVVDAGFGIVDLTGEAQVVCGPIPHDRPGISKRRMRPFLHDAVAVVSDDVRRIENVCHDVMRAAIQYGNRGIIEVEGFFEDVASSVIFAHQVPGFVIDVFGGLVPVVVAGELGDALA